MWILTVSLVECENVIYVVIYVLNVRTYQKTNYWLNTKRNFF